MTSKGFEKRDLRNNSVALIADDVQRDVNFLKRVLKNYHFGNILAFQNPWDAIEIFETGMGDILFVNLENGLMNALDTAKHIKRDPKSANTPVIITSYDCTQENVIASRNAGADGFIVKPLSEKGIISQLTKAATFTTDKLLSNLSSKRATILEKGLDLNSEHSDKIRLLKPYCEPFYFIIFGYPFFFTAYVELSKIFFALNEDERAVDLLKKAHCINPKAVDPLDTLADYYSEMGNHTQSLVYIKEYAEVCPNVNAFGKLGDTLLKCGQLDQAIIAINKAICLNESKQKMRVSREEHSLHFNTRGQIHQKMGEEKKNISSLGLAVDDFNKAIELNPSLVAAQYNLMQTYQKLGKTPLAIEVLDKLRKIEPDDPESWLLMAESYFNENDLKKTYSAIQKALSLRKNNLRFNIRISKLLFTYNILDKAKELLLQLISIDEKNSSLYNRLGLISRREGKPEEAVKWYKKGLSIAPEDAAIWFNLAKALLENSDMKLGYEALKKCKELDPDLDISWSSVFKEHL